ncbi:MAG: hypothetical protein KGI58_00635 [Patescibacteria group bacterium]|nr:hypothetical protein [Patescibacteria group bacterium]
MKSILRLVMSPENILSYAIGFVVVWFGLHEMFNPQDWVTFAPPFLGDGALANNLVVLHGIILTSCGILLFINSYRHVVSIILSLVFIEIILTLVTQTGLSDIAVRDIGLFGMAISLFFVVFERRKVLPK